MSRPEPTITRFADSPRTPWRNGSGTTRELLKAPSAHPDAPFAWRISVADVSNDGQFSAFEGVDRVLILCEGTGLVVVVNGCSEVLRRFDTIAFPGEAHVTARLLQGPTTDLNVMTARRTTRATVRVQTVDGPVGIRSQAADSVVLVVLEGDVALQSEPVATPQALAAFDAVHLPGGSAARLCGRGRIARIHLVSH